MTQFKYGALPLSVWMLGAVSSAVTTGVLAEDDDGMEEVRLLSTPASSVSLGAGYSSDDLTMLGRYNGRSDSGAYLLLDFDINQRDDDTGTWTLVDGFNLGSSSRLLRYEKHKQGDWRYAIEFDQLDSRSPYSLVTDLQGVGSSDQATGGASRSLELSQERKNFILEMSKRYNQVFDFSLNFRQEDKKGDRSWGSTYARTGAGRVHFFVAEPIDYKTQELEATVDYTTEQLQLRGGYLLSMFDNPIERVQLDAGSTGSSPDQFTTSTTPDNHSQNLYLSGGYNLSELTRGSFKFSYQQDQQNESFYQTNPNNARADLGGTVDTLRFNLGLSSRVSPKLRVKAKLNYVDRDDNTPKDIYLSTNGRYNQRISRTQLDLLLDSTYRLKPGTALTAAVGYQEVERDTTDAPDMARRKTVDEYGLHLGARKQLSETLNGSVKYSYLDRSGSSWQDGSGIAVDTLLSGPQPFNYVNSIQFADRERHQFKLMLDWYASEQLSFQLIAKARDDSYSGLPLGARDGRSLLSSLDASYQINDEWRFNAWVSADRQELDSATHSWEFNPADFANSYATSQQYWSGEATDSGAALGLGIEGETDDELKLKASLEYSDDESRFDMASLPVETAQALDPQYAPASSLSTINYEQLRFRMSGEYPLDEQRGVRVDYQYDRIENNDWSWNNHTDYVGTLISQAADESNHFIGISFYYRGW